MPHVLNFGMGVESTAILLRWILEPETRPFPLENLIVLSAQTGDEFPSTKFLVEQYLLPLLREHNIRYVQVAKTGPSVKDGITILSDTRQPDECHIEGDYRLSDENLKTGTTPLYSGPHICAQKWKGDVIDSWLATEMKGRVFGPYLGYNADETGRISKSSEYGARGFEYRYPLQEWGWDRLKCIQYIQQHLGVVWKKSCCVFCPFIQRQVAADRYLEEPESASFALFNEAMALATNPRMQLFSHGTAHQLCRDTGNHQALALFETHMDSVPWGIYRIERTYEQRFSDKTGKPYKSVARRLTQIETGTRQAMHDRLQVLAHDEGRSVEDMHHFQRVVSHHRENNASNSCEGFWVACPAVMPDKVRHAQNFERTWQWLTAERPEWNLYRVDQIHEPYIKRNKEPGIKTKNRIQVLQTGDYETLATALDSIAMEHGQDIGTGVRFGRQVSQVITEPALELGDVKGEGYYMIHPPMLNQKNISSHSFQQQWLSLKDGLEQMLMFTMPTAHQTKS